MEEEAYRLAYHYHHAGELGRALGPVLIIAIVQWVGLERSYLAAIPVIVFSALMFPLVGPIRRGAKPVEQAALRAILRDRRNPLLLLLAFVWTRALFVGSLGAFTPSYLTTSGLQARPRWQRSTPQGCLPIPPMPSSRRARRR